MFAHFAPVVRTRFGVRSFAALVVFFVSISATLLRAQDARTVVEPTFPTTCTALAAQQTIVSGEPASETTLDTTRIQAALTACPSGQAVELTLGGTNNANGAFLTGPLNIPKGVTLLVDGGVTLFGSRNPADYQSTVSGVETCGTVGTAGNGCVPLIQINSGSSSSGSGVMGYGVINGRGGDKLLLNGVAQTYSWWDLANQANGHGAQNNPILLYAKNASNFTLYKITLMNSPMFHVKYQTASGFTVWGVKIVTPYSSRNTDGIDPDDKITNITITNSYISDGDDDIALGASGSSNLVSNVTISNVHTYSGHGVSIGSYTSGGVSNVYVNNVNQSGNLADSNSAGLKIKSAQDRGGLVNNISYNNVCIQNIRYPLQFNPTYNTNSGTSYPSYQNIALHGISVVGIAGGQNQFDGLNANFPLGITLDNVNITGTQPALTPTPQFVNFTLGPGPVTPASLQSIAGTGITYAGNITNPTETPQACPTTNFPGLAGELYLSTTTLNNQQTISLPGPATFTLNAVVEVVEASNPTPTSPIQFFEGTNQVGSATLSSNGTLASVTLTGVTSGTHIYTARYPADTAYAQLNFGSVTVNVSSTATSTMVTATPASAVYGANISLVATVQPASGTAVPTGTVTFSSGTTVIGTATLNASGVATLATTTLPVGNNAIVASYGGGTSFGASDSTAMPVNVNVTQAGTTTTVGAAPANSTFGGTVVLTATVTPATSGAPTGTVTFMDGSTNLGTATVTPSSGGSGSIAQLSVGTLSAGVHSISAIYGGDTNYKSSTSVTSAPETVSAAVTTTTLSLSAGSAFAGQSVTLTASVASAAGAPSTGMVSFLNGATTLGTGTVTNGIATLVLTNLTVGTDSITASFAASGNFAASVSAVSTLTVVAPVTLSLSPASLSLAAGATGSSTLTISPANGFTGSVALVCSSPVAYITCSVTTPVSITGANPGTPQVTVTVAGTYGELRMPQIGPERGSTAVALAALLPFGALILLPLVRCRKRLLQQKGFRIVALLLMAAGVSLTVTGCGGSSTKAPSLPPAGSQTITITATANSATVTTSLTVNVTN